MHLLAFITLRRQQNLLIIHLKISYTHRQRILDNLLVPLPLLPLRLLNELCLPSVIALSLQMHLDQVDIVSTLHSHHLILHAPFPISLRARHVHLDIRSILFFLKLKFGLQVMVLLVLVGRWELIVHY